jgi:hypothetical protein
MDLNQSRFAGSDGRNPVLVVRPRLHPVCTLSPRPTSTAVSGTTISWATRAPSCAASSSLSDLVPHLPVPLPAPASPHRPARSAPAGSDHAQNIVGMSQQRASDAWLTCPRQRETVVLPAPTCTAAAASSPPPAPPARPRKAARAALHSCRLPKRYRLSGKRPPLPPDSPGQRLRPLPREDGSRAAAATPPDDPPRPTRQQQCSRAAAPWPHRTTRRRCGHVAEHLSRHRHLRRRRRTLCAPPVSAVQCGLRKPEVRRATMTSGRSYSRPRRRTRRSRPKCHSPCATVKRLQTRWHRGSRWTACKGIGSGWGRRRICSGRAPSRRVPIYLPACNRLQPCLAACGVVHGWLAGGAWPPAAAAWLAAGSSCIAHKESYIHISLRMNSSRRLRSQSIEE